MARRETFFKIISPEHLYTSALVFAILTAIVVSIIYVYLFVKKRRYRIKSKLNDIIDNWITESITDEEEKPLEIPKELMMYFNKRVFRQFITEKLIIVKKSIRGKSGAEIELLYKELGLLDDSVNKMNSSAWHKKAKGIYELYMMNQRSQHADIMKYTNHNRKYVRREAQAAIIGFSGFDGLVFLEKLTFPLYEWQQVKLLGQLQAMNTGTLTNIHLWLRSENVYVVQFSLKLAEIYQQYQVHDIVAESLNSEQDKIRYQAIKTLGEIANEETATILKEHYNKENTRNKRRILRQLAIIGSSDDIDFLRNKLSESDDALKLEAGRSLVRIDKIGWEILNELMSEDETLYSIGKQIKYELA